ncbi:MAG TPA: outer membrane protein assembly factor BamE [Leucothrix mucor]|nr:outer membrane protein assembly factor BamE [Leucothrix mucor]
MKKLIILSLVFFLSACSNYKLDVQQGNLVTQESISKLQRGMSKQDVKSLLGTPLLNDNFDNNRWDYIFYRNRENAKQKPQSVTLRFQKNQLIGISN